MSDVLFFAIHTLIQSNQICAILRCAFRLRMTQYFQFPDLKGPQWSHMSQNVLEYVKNTKSLQSKASDLNINSDITHQILPRSNIRILGETPKTKKSWNTLVVTHSVKILSQKQIKINTFFFLLYELICVKERMLYDLVIKQIYHHIYFSFLNQKQRPDYCCSILISTEMFHLWFRLCVLL